MKCLQLLVLVLISLLFFEAGAKPFKRVLVISGGGINPGASLGMIAGVQEMGWHPDLVIATCGAGMGAAIYNSEQAIDASYEALLSKNVFEELGLIQIDNGNGVSIINKLNKGKNVSRYPDIFENNLLYSPLGFSPDVLKRVEFNRDPAKTKLIILSARALFYPHQVGQKRLKEPMFTQTYFTDPETGELLKSRRLPGFRSYPFTNLTAETLTITDRDALTAMRSGIADPYLLNPNIIDGYYHFTGAVDLFPIDLATELGDEVVATYPSALFLDYEKSAVYSAFGFDQTTKALEAIQHKNVKWIDISGTDELSFNPTRTFVVMRNSFPTDYMDYRLRVAKQWEFGRDRANEALRMAPGTITDVRSHLRKPINPKLLEEFTCKNAYEWKTEWRDSCKSDFSRLCDRRQSKKCVPIR